jgi:hypothetical protein
VLAEDPAEDAGQQHASGGAAEQDADHRALALSGCQARRQEAGDLGGHAGDPD